MIINFKTSDFWLIDDDLFLGLLGFEVAEGAGGGKSAWEDPKRASDGVIEPVRHFSDGCGLVDLASSFDDSLLLISVRWLVIFGDLIALIELFTCKDSPGVTQVGCIAQVIMDEDHQGTATAVVPLLPPFPVSFDECFSEGRGNVLAPVQVEEVLMEFVLQELRAFGTTMTIVYAKPLRIFLEIDGDLVLIALPVETLMSDGSIGFQVGSEASSYSLREFWDLAGGLFSGLFLFAFLAGIVQKRSLQGLGDEVGIDAVLIDAGGGEHFFEVFAGVSRLNELLLGRLGFRLDNGDVF